MSRFPIVAPLLALVCHNEHQGRWYWYTVFRNDKTSAIKWQHHCTHLSSLWWLKCCRKMENWYVSLTKSISKQYRQWNHLLTFRLCNVCLYAQILDLFILMMTPSPLSAYVCVSFLFFFDFCSPTHCIMIPLKNDILGFVDKEENSQTCRTVVPDIVKVLF